MSSMSYLSVIERYHDYRDAIHQLMASILSGILEPRLFSEPAAQRQALLDINEHYPFVELLYILDGDGHQISDNISVSVKTEEMTAGHGKDRSQRAYYQLAKASDDVVVTSPYLSSATRALCLSAAIRRTTAEGEERIVVIDIDLAETIEFLMGDTARRRFQPLFKFVYAAIAAVLFLVVAVLFYFGLEKFLNVFAEDTHASSMSPFSVVIFITLALAIFDLGKTIFEEEVLMHKDIYRHSSTRRTITRFIAAILIAVSIEALMILFKAVLGDTEQILSAVYLLMCSIGLMVGLGVYVYLGAKAEKSFVQLRR